MLPAKMLNQVSAGCGPDHEADSTRRTLLFASLDPDHTVPVRAGGFVRRVAHTPHYDGVKKGAREPVVVGIFGLAPVDLKLVDPSKPAWRYA